MPVHKSIHFKSRGFTLLEIMVVMVIIGVIASVTIANVLVTRKRSRDATRKADIEAIYKALELFTNDTAGGAKYPNTITGSLVTGNYIKKLPTDPKFSVNVGTNNYFYTPYQLDGLTACSSGGDTPDLATNGNCRAFKLTACLENDNDIGRNVTLKPFSGDGVTCPGTSGLTRIYQVKSE